MRLFYKTHAPLRRVDNHLKKHYPKNPTGIFTKCGGVALVS
jgi:hypothetical protein